MAKKDDEKEEGLMYKLGYLMGAAARRREDARDEAREKARKQAEEEKEAEMRAKEAEQKAREAEKNDPNITLGQRIGCTLFAPAVWFLGIIIGAIVSGSGGANLVGGIISLVYLVFSVVMVWVHKHAGFIVLLVALNLAVGIAVCFIPI